LIFCVESQIHADANAESDEDAAAPPKPLPSEETKLEKEELDFRRNARELRDRVNADPEHEKTAVEELVEIKGQLLREERYSQSLRTQLFELQVELQQHADFKNDYNIKYVECLQRAKVENMTDLAELDFISVSGKDVADRDVVTIAAANLPEKGIDLDRILVYVISVLKTVVEKEYVVVWLNTTKYNEQQVDWVFRPSVGWFKECHEMLPLQWRKNLHQAIFLCARAAEFVC